jgi:hypothetical protein
VRREGAGFARSTISPPRRPVRAAFPFQLPPRVVGRHEELTPSGPPHAVQLLCRIHPALCPLRAMPDRIPLGPALGSAQRIAPSCSPAVTAPLARRDVPRVLAPCASLAAFSRKPKTPLGITPPASSVFFLVFRMWCYAWRIPARRGRLQEDWPEARGRERRLRARANSLCARAASGSPRRTLRSGPMPSEEGEGAR